jgi:CheY-like chemotaxis protein
MDHRMPELNGMEATRLLKSNDATKTIPVIYFTGLDNGRQLAREAGADGYLGKPFKVDDLTRTIEKALAGDGQAGS